MKSRFGLLLLVLGAGACRGKVAGTAPLMGPGTVTAHVVATGPIQVWADTDVRWVGPKSSKPELEYDVELKQNGKDVGRLQCSTSDRSGTSICGGHSNIMGEHNADCEISLNCPFPSISGDIEVKVTGRTGANVKSVKKMSLNFRSR